jgi:hypothetical protein
MKSYCAVTFAVSMLVLCGSGVVRGKDKPEAIAQKAAESWLKLWDAGKYKESYEELARDTKARYTPRNWYVYWYGVRKPLGEVKSRKLIQAEYKKSLPDKADQEAVLLMYESSFENNESVRESLVLFLERDGTWRVWVYITNQP